MEITRVSPSRITVHVDGETLTGIATGIPARGFAAQQVSGVARSGGVVFSDGRYEQWPVRRVVEDGGEFYLCGPTIEGMSVAEELASAPVTRTAWLVALLRAVAATADDADLTVCNVRTTLINPDGGVLLLKSDLASRINGNLTVPQRRVVHFPYRPELPHSTDVEIYQALAVVYHALSGHPLCSATEVQSAARCHAASLDKRPIRIHRPEISDALRDLIDPSLQYRAQRNPETLQKIAEIIASGAAVDEIDDEERDRRTQEAQEQLTRNQSGAQRRTFWRNHWKTVALAALATTAVLAVPIGIVRRALTPPATAGMGPEQVVTTFYDAWGDLDHVTMSETVARGVARGAIREVTNVYVIDRVQMAHQWRSIIMPADRWMEESRPAGRAPYGITGLEIRSVRIGESSASMVAEYDIWRPETEESEAGTIAGTAIRTRTTDEITLSTTRFGWEISSWRTTPGEVTTVPLDLTPDPERD